MNTVEFDFSKIDVETHEKRIRELGLLLPPRFILKNVSVFMRNPGFYMLQLFLERTMEKEGYIMNFCIDGGGIIGRGEDYDISEDDLNGYFTAIYYPLDDKIVALQHNKDLK